MSNFRLIVNTQYIYNQELFDIYMKNFSNDLIFNPFFRYFNIIHIYLWFTLVNSNNEIIGECSIEEISDKDSYIKTFEFHDVFIQEKFRGNNYALLMITNVLYYLDKNYYYYDYIIKTCDNNYPALKTYKKILGEPVYENGYAVFKYIHSIDNLEIQ